MRTYSLFNKIRNKFLKFRILFLLLAIGILFLPLLKPGEDTPSMIVFFLGRFHPLVVHFPIVLILFALIFEILTKLKLIKTPVSISGILLVTGFLSCLGALILGYLLYYTQEYSGNIIEEHLWGGVLLTASVSLSLYLLLTYKNSGSKNLQRAYLIVLSAANIILIYTSHHGGSLTHGEGYLTQYFPGKNQNPSDWEPKPMEEMLVYEDVIMAFLDKKCMSCHNENKSKGGLILTTYEDLIKGGKGDHPTLVLNSSSESDIFRRVTLSSNDDDFMPPEGKTPLSSNEILLLKWWIDSGADPEIRLTEITDSEIEPVISIYLSELEKEQRNRFLQKLNTEDLIRSVKNLDKVELTIDPYDEKSIFLSMTFPPSKFRDDDLLDLQPLFQRITKASFIGSDITDDGLYRIGQMNSLKELYIQQTQIKGDGIAHLSKIGSLEILDLSKTNVSDGHLLHILQIPSLKELYLNETSISKEVINALKENRADLQIYLERGKLF
jgi:uncharacterized membrane protein